VIDAELKALLTNPEALFTELRKDTTLEALKGRFVQGEKVKNFHTATLEDGTKIAFRFIDCIKFLLDVKMKKIYGRDSFLSYLEITVYPAGAKAFTKVFDVKQVVQGVSKPKAYEKHSVNLAKLVDIATKAGIDLTSQDSWSRTYVESYKDLR